MAESVNEGYSANVTVIEEQRTSKTYQVTPQMRQDIKESLIHVLRSDPHLVKEILNESLSVKSEEIIFKKIDKAEAKIQIQKYIEDHAGCRTSDIIETLELDPVSVLEILKELKDNDIVESKTIGQ